MSNETLHKILEIISEVGGYFVVKNESGEEFVIMRREDALSTPVTSEKQLPLPAAPALATADDILERINQELALYQAQQNEAAEEAEIEEIVEKIEEAYEPPMRIRFEPLRGDLPPELQD